MKGEGDPCGLGFISGWFAKHQEEGRGKEYKSYCFWFMESQLSTDADLGSPLGLHFPVDDDDAAAARKILGKLKPRSTTGHRKTIVEEEEERRQFFKGQSHDLYICHMYLTTHVGNQSYSLTPSVHACLLTEIFSETSTTQCYRHVFGKALDPPPRILWQGKKVPQKTIAEAEERKRTNVAEKNCWHLSIEVLQCTPLFSVY